MIVEKEMAVVSQKQRTATAWPFEIKAGLTGPGDGLSKTLMSCMMPSLGHGRARFGQWGLDVICKAQIAASRHL